MRWRGILTFFRPVAAGLAAAAAVAVAAQNPPARAAPDSAADDVILRMEQAWRSRDRAALAQLLPQAVGHPLEAWAAYWELRVRLEDAADDEVRQFLQRWSGTYQEDRLRNDWLLLLGKRRDWATFKSEYAKFRMRDDPQLRCYDAAALLEGGTRPQPKVLEQLRRDWYEQRRLDDGCLYAAGRLYRAGLLAERDIWKKARLAQEEGQVATVRAVAALISPEAAAGVSQIGKSVLRYLAQQESNATGADRQLAVLALVALARKDADQAARMLSATWAARLPPSDRNWLWGVIGKWSALSRSPLAVQYFSNVGSDRELDDDLLAWKVRAALRAGQWKVIPPAVDAMTDPAADAGAWRYWKARAQLALAGEKGDRSAGLAGLEQVARQSGQRNFYSKLADEALGRPIAVPPEPAPPTAAERAAAEGSPGLQRALLALALGLRSEGVREWNYWLNLHQPGGVTERERYAAADLACRLQVWDRCINTSDRTRSFISMKQRYPMPFGDLVVRSAGAAGLSPALLYGLIRQESRFDPDARSVAGAAGLMQVMPATARWTARRIGLAEYTPASIFDPGTNLQLGTSYFKIAYDDFDHSLPITLAAYNAGPKRSQRWRDGPLLEGAVWVENIPFSETRDYVKQVLSNIADYALLDGQPQTMTTLLGTVGPPSPGQTDAGAELP